MKETTSGNLEELVCAAQSGDEAAMARLIQATQDPLYRFCYYLTNNPTLAQDLAQDTFVKSLEQIKKLKDTAKFKQWLFQSAKNLFLDHVKSPKNKSANIDDVPETGVEGDATTLPVRETLMKLKPEERMVLVLIDIEEHTALEAGEILGISEDAVRSRLHRARQAFIDAYKK